MSELTEPPIYVDFDNKDQASAFNAAMPCNRFYEDDTKRYGYFQNTPERRADLRRFFAEREEESKRAKAEGRLPDFMVGKVVGKANN